MCDSITELLHIHDAGYCEEPLNKVNSSCSRNYCKAALWHVILLEADSEDGYTVITKGWTRSATIAGVFLLNNILLVLGAWLADTRQDVFTPNSDPTVWISEQKSKIIGPGNIYPACCCRPCEPQLPVLSLHQWSCAALEVCRPHRDALLHALYAVSGYLSYCFCPISLKQSGHSPLTSTRHSPRELLLTGYFLFSRPFQKYQPPRHIQRHLNPRLSLTLS